MKKIGVNDLPLTIAHGEVPRKKLLGQGDIKSNLQSLNDAYVEPGKSFKPHNHEDSEELYYFLEGEGKMTIDKETFNVKSGDLIVIEMKEFHSLINTGQINLRFLVIKIKV